MSESHMSDSRIKRTKIAFAAVWIYVMVTLTIYPLFLIHGYNEPDRIKYIWWLVTTLIMVSVVMIMDLTMRVKRLTKGELTGQKPEVASVRRTLNPIDICMLAYLVISIAGTVFSPYRREALTGCPGWWMGLLPQMLLMATYYVISRHAGSPSGIADSYRLQSICAAAIMAASVILHSIAIIQRFGCDPLHMYGDAPLILRQEYLSTIGQITWYTSYTVLILPLGMYCYIYGKSTWLRLLATAYLITYSATICTAYADSGYAATAAVIIVLLYVSVSHGNRLHLIRYAGSVVIMVGAALLTRILRNACADRVIPAGDGADIITEMVTSPAVMGMVIIVGLMIIVVLYVTGLLRDKRTDTLIPLSARTISIISLTITGLIIMVLSYCIARTLLTSLSGVGGNGLFFFNDEWGNDRGLIWRIAVGTWWQAPPLQKLIGSGPDTFFRVADDLYYAEMASRWGSVTVPCAHNEWLNVLVTGGVLGLIAYLGIYVSAIAMAVRWLRRDAQTEAKDAMQAGAHPMLVTSLATVCAYMAHNTFCYQQCVCTPVVMIAIGIISAYSYVKKSPVSIR